MANAPSAANRITPKTTGVKISVSLLNIYANPTPKNIMVSVSGATMAVSAIPMAENQKI